MADLITSSSDPDQRGHPGRILLVLFVYRASTTWPGMAIVAVGVPVYWAVRRFRSPRSDRAAAYPLMASEEL